MKALLRAQVVRAQAAQVYHDLLEDTPGLPHPQDLDGGTPGVGPPEDRGRPGRPAPDRPGPAGELSLRSQAVGWALAHAAPTLQPQAQTEEAPLPRMTRMAANADAVSRLLTCSWLRRLIHGFAVPSRLRLEGRPPECTACPGKPGPRRLPRPRSCGLIFGRLPLRNPSRPPPRIVCNHIDPNVAPGYNALWFYCGINSRGKSRMANGLCPGQAGTFAISSSGHLGSLLPIAKSSMGPPRRLRFRPIAGPNLPQKS